MAGEATTITFHCADVRLGYGVYFLRVGVCGPGLEDELWHIVDRAWSFQVLRAGDCPVLGTVDLGFQYAVSTSQPPTGGVAMHA